MNSLIIFTKDDFDKLKFEMVKDLKEVITKTNTPPRWMRSAEVRKLLGGISPAKLQSLRIRGHLPATYADGMWLYCFDDVIEFLERNKTTGKENDNE